MKLKNHELSILIPVYNSSCVKMVEMLSAQARNLGISYEVIVADDASTDKETISQNRQIEQFPHCRFCARPVNTGRSANRNFLAQQAQYAWLLFLDSDQEIPASDFLARYLAVTEQGIVVGGIRMGGDGAALAGNLRFLYEKHGEPFHTAQARQKRPYHSFRSCNFLVEREVMRHHPFDERFKGYGYEDVLLGKQCRLAGVRITHIDNPVVMTRFEDNPQYVQKIETSLQTLQQFRNDLKGYSRFITISDGIHFRVVKSLLRGLFRLAAPLLRRNLCGSHPSLSVFNLYRVGYFLSLETSQNE